MNTIESKIRELVTMYRAQHLNNGEGMLPPANETQIVKVENQLGFQLPSSLRSLYAVYGGQTYTPPGTTGIFGSHRLLPPMEIIKDYKMYQENEGDAAPHSPPGEESSYWQPGLVPFATWDSYSLVMCCRTQRVWEFEPYLGLSKRCFATLDALLDEALISMKTSNKPSLDFITED